VKSNAYTILVGKQKERGHQEDLDLGGKLPVSRWFLAQLIFFTLKM
jgi:hypothetical protein